ncbi:MAG: hypothetical protein WC897_00340 [Candidatus Gracilibacteria bacterium]
MYKFLSFLVAGVLFSGCALISPYTITFTNDNWEVIDPATSTIDFVVSQATLAYISEVSCEGATPLEFLPIVKDSMEVSTVHKLPLTVLEDQAPGVACAVTVTVFDKTTTAQSSASLNVTMAGTKVEEDTTEMADDVEATTETTTDGTTATDETPAVEEVTADPITDPVDVATDPLADTPAQ